MVSEDIIKMFAGSTARADREQIYDRAFAEYGSAIRRIASVYARSTSDRDDLVQDIAIALWQSLPAFRNESSLKTFIFRIAQNRAISYLSRQRPRDSDVEEEEEIPDIRPNPEAMLSREQQKQQLLDAVSRLPLPYRQVMTLVLEGLDYEEIAETLALSIANVGARLSRGRRLLQQRMRIPQ
jgi:RNA polymerase sigma factor (sigma-70 family)